MKVLLSAFACRPDHGSEPEVGYQTLMAVAKSHDVWLLTSDYYLPGLELRLASSPLRQRINLVPTGWVISDEDMHRHGRAGFHWRYDRWQRQAAQVAVELDRQVDFDLVHHVTLATYWSRAGVAAVEKPFVWGPVGGGVHPPVKLLRELGWKGLPGDVGRELNRLVLGNRPTIKRAVKASTVAVAQNDSTRRRLHAARDVRVLSNGLCVDLADLPPGAGRSRDVVFAGRLVAWKGVTLCVRAFRHVQHPEARLRIYGVGPEGARLRRLIRRWGLEDRVLLEGRVPRPVLLERIASSAALLHPSMHDEGGTVVAEALSLGTPVVCLQRGGPAEIIKSWPNTPSVAVTPGTPEITAQRIAAALDGIVESGRPGQPGPPTTTYANALEEIYQQAVQDARTARA